MNQLYLAIPFLALPIFAEASCDPRTPISTADQNEIINKIIINKLKSLRYEVNKEFHNNSDTNFFKIEIPELYKDVVLDSVNVTYWDSNQIPVAHASLSLDRGFSFKNEVVKEDLAPMPLEGWDRTGSKIFTLSFNKNSQLTPSITLNFGNMCYNHFEMSIKDMPNLIEKKLQSH